MNVHQRRVITRMLEVSVPGAIVGLLLLVSSAIGQNVSNQHIEYGVTTLHNDQDACPSDDQRNEIRAVISDNVHTLLQTQVLLLLQGQEGTVFAPKLHYSNE